MLQIINIILEVKGQGQIKTKLVIRLITRTPLSCLRARVYIYGTMIVYGAWFLITALLLVSKDKVKYLYNQFMACCPSLFDQGCSEDSTTLLTDSVGAYFVVGSHCVFFKE